MSRRRNHIAQSTLRDRDARIEKLIRAGWIASSAEIPADAIPVDPELINLGGSWSHPTYYRAVQFTCSDCEAHQIWEAEDQRWYYETTQAPYYSLPKRCRPCRKQEQTRKRLARIAAGHEEPKA